MYSFVRGLNIAEVSLYSSGLLHHRLKTAGWLSRDQDVSFIESRTWIDCSVNICCLITSDFMFAEHNAM